MTSAATFCSTTLTLLALVTQAWSSMMLNWTIPHHSVETRHKWNMQVIKNIYTYKKKLNREADTLCSLQLCQCNSLISPSKWSNHFLLRVLKLRGNKFHTQTFIALRVSKELWCNARLKTLIWDFITAFPACTSPPTASCVNVWVIYDAWALKTFLTVNERLDFSTVIMDYQHIIYRNMKYATSLHLFCFHLSPVTHRGARSSWIY